MKTYLKLINTNTHGSRNDVTPLFKDFGAFSALTDDICALVKSVDIDLVAGIDALGFILGTAVAFRLEKGFLGIRKGKKLPVEVDTVMFTDYTGTTKSLEIATNSLQQDSKVLLVDEWIETGAQVRAAANLIEKQGGIVMAITAIAMENNEKTKDIFEKYRCLPLTDGRIMDLLGNNI